MLEQESKDQSDGDAYEERKAREARILDGARTSKTKLYLPLITDEIAELLAGSSLMVEDDSTTSGWHWTEDAVEFACILNRQLSAADETTACRYPNCADNRPGVIYCARRITGNCKGPADHSSAEGTKP